MDRIKNTFDKCKAENRKALVMFAVMGNPDLPTSEKLIVEIASAGADIIELGVPFSDPMADGPVRAAEWEFHDCQRRPRGCVSTPRRLPEA